MKLQIRRSISGLLAGILALCAWPAAALGPARTRENVQRKAVVITHDARIFTASQGDGGAEAPFMQVYFLLEGESGGRVPVSIEPNKPEPDGWLAKGSFAEWNTLQMINFEPQSGRELAKIFSDSGCAERFGLTGEASGCQELGSEPQRAGKTRDDYALLIPIFESQVDNYRGGFVRVNAEGKAIAPQVDPEAGKRTTAGESKLGYDLVLVVDATASMQQWFRPTTSALRSFLGKLRGQIGNGGISLNVGLMFYRDRKVAEDCDIGFLTQWAVDLTDDVESVTAALEQATETSCGSDDLPEAVYDALNRAVQDPKWHDGHFKVVLLVGDAPPHPASNRIRNPMGLTTEAIVGMAGERNLRFLTFKIGLEDTEAFKNLALSGKEEVQGQFRAIEPDPEVYEQTLLKALEEEWALLTKANQVYQAGIDPKQLSRNPQAASAAGIDLDAYELPIIIANLPPNVAGKGASDFVEGWTPKKIKGKLAIGEHVFMSKREVQLFVNVIESIALHAEGGVTEGSDAFLASLRSALAQLLNVQPDQLFRSGESLESMLRKAEILPFHTTVLSFTAEEVNTWRPADFERLNKILTEKTELLRAFIQKPGNQRLFGSVPHVYVPRDLFP